MPSPPKLLSVSLPCSNVNGTFHPIWVTTLALDFHLEAATAFGLFVTDSRSMAQLCAKYQKFFRYAEYSPFAPIG